MQVPPARALEFGPRSLGTTFASPRSSPARYGSLEDCSIAALLVSNMSASAMPMSHLGGHHHGPLSSLSSSPSTTSPLSDSLSCASLVQALQQVNLSRSGSTSSVNSLSLNDRPSNGSSNGKSCAAQEEVVRRKKSVSFADACGQTLTEVKLYTNTDLFVVPKSAYKNLNLPSSWDWDDTPTLGSNRPFTYYYTAPGSPQPATRRRTESDAAALYTLVPEFSMPGLAFGFEHRVEEKKVCLDRLTVTSVSGNRAVQFDICVYNVDFRKTVVVRYTTNNWASHTDALASYLPNSTNGNFDKFRANISIPSCLMAPGSRLLFAIKYATNGGAQEYWDNNGSDNYALIFRKTTPAVANKDVVNKAIGQDTKPTQSVSKYPHFRPTTRSPSPLRMYY